MVFLDILYTTTDGVDGAILLDPSRLNTSSGEVIKVAALVSIPSSATYYVPCT